MKKLILSILNAILSIALLAWVFPSVTYLDYTTLIGAGIVLALLQMFVRPLLKLLLLPINIITLGLFSWVINVFVLWLVDAVVPGFDILPTVFFGYQLGSFGTLLLMTFMLSLAQTFVGIFIK